MTTRRQQLQTGEVPVVPVDAAGVDELGVVPWPVVLRRRIAHKVGIDRRWAVLWIVLGGLFTVSVTITVLVVSLQGIADDLHSNVTVLNWALTGPMLAFGVVGPVFGKAGDLWGHKRVFVAGLLVAGLFAVATALAWNAGSLIAFRVVSASAGSACGPSAMAYINRMFAPGDRVRPLGYWSFVSAGAPVIGVVAGGPLVEAFGWRVIFAVQAPLCLVGVAVAIWLLPDTEPVPGVRFDVKGSITLGAGAGLLLAAISQAHTWGWASAATLGCLAVSLACLVLFVSVERRAEAPLVVLRWLRTRNIAFPVASQTLANFAYMGGFILIPQVLDRGMGIKESVIGLLVIARPLTFSLTAPTAGFVTLRVGERVAGVAGGIAVALSMLLFATLQHDTTRPFIVAALALSGLGLGLAAPALTSLTADAVEDRDLGIVGAMQQLMTQLGAVIGAAVLTAAGASGGADDFGPFHSAFLAGAVVAAAGALAAGFVRPSRPRAVR